MMARILLTLFTLSIFTASARTNNNVYVIPNSGNLPTWAQVNLSSPNAITGQAPIGNGGTGQATKTLGFNALSPLSTKGDLIGFDGTNNVRFGVGSNNQILTADATQTVGYKWAAGAANSVTYLANMGITGTVATNALTVTLTDSSGGTLSGSDQAVANFRSATTATGQYTTVNISAPLSIVVPSGASLGQASAVNQYVWIYLLNDAGVADICVSGVNLFDEGSNQSSTGISAGSANGTVLYCSISHAGSKPIRVVGRLLVNEATAGTWASAPTEIDIGITPKKTITEWAAIPSVAAGTWVLSVGAGAVNPSYGTTANNTAIWRRDGANIQIRWDFRQTGAGTAGTASFYVLNMFSSLQADTTKLVANTGLNFYDDDSRVCQGFAASSNNSIQMMDFNGYLYTAAQIKFIGNFNDSAISGNRLTWSSANPFNFASTQMSISLQCDFPIFGWSAYGP